MRYLSICSGIEAASMAWEPLGWTPMAFAEIAPFPSAVLAHRWPHVPNLGDFTTITLEQLLGILGPLLLSDGVLIGGTPCQSFSVAGLRAGLADPRGNLALAFLRLAHLSRARWLVWENVPGVLTSVSHDAPDQVPPGDDVDVGCGEYVVEEEYEADERSDFGCFLAALSEFGYGWSYRILDAQYFGVAQRRRRVFVVAHLGDWRPAAAVLSEPHCLSGHPAPSREAGTRVAALSASGVGSSGADDNQAQVGHLVPVGGEAGPQAFGGGNTSGPLSVSTALTALTAHGGRYDFDTETLIAAPVSPTLPASGAGTARTGNEWTEADFLIAHTPVAFSCKDHGADAGEIAPTLRAMGHDKSHANRGGQVAVAFNWQSGGDVRLDVTGERTGALHASQTPAVMAPLPFDTTQITSAANYSNPKPGDPRHPLAAQAHPPAVATRQAVRRITPREAEDLQGMRSTPSRPYDHTLIPGNWRRRKEPDRSETVAYLLASGYTPEEADALADCPDGPRYHAIGNSMAIPCVRWIGERIEAVEAILAAERERKAA